MISLICLRLFHLETDNEECLDKPRMSSICEKVLNSIKHKALLQTFAKTNFNLLHASVGCFTLESQLE